MSLFRRKSRHPIAELDHAELVDLAYRGILGREADPEGRRSYLDRLNSGAISPADLLRELLESEERGRLVTYQPDAASHESLPCREPELVARLQQCTALSQQDYDDIWQQTFASDRDLVIGQQEYAPQHRARFWELFNAVALLLEECADENPRLLEFGVSEYTGFYQSLWPQLALDVADRPVEDSYPGFNRATSLRVSGAKAFHAVDLNRRGVFYEDRYRDLQGAFHVVVFTEVLEHLVANPTETIAQLLSLLCPTGSLYLTTPNFFRKENMALIAQRENPQEVYPAGDDNWDAHHHYRELCAQEMIRFIESAGGVCRAFYYSDCWDEDDPEERAIHERSNMVFVISRPPAAGDQ
jgi:hypothetical protein